MHVNSIFEVVFEVVLMLLRVKVLSGFSPTPGQSKDKACKAIFLTLINSLILLTDAQKTGSFRFSNLHTHYAGSFNDTDLNARIVRGEVGQDLPVSFPSMNGQIESPMVSLYLGSIPLFQWQQQRYCEKVQLSARCVFSPYCMAPILFHH